MTKTLNEIAEELGIIHLSFDEIFTVQESESEKIQHLLKLGFFTDVETMREYLVNAGKRCSIYVTLLNFFDDEIKKAKEEIEHYYSYGNSKWLPIITIHRDIYELIGFLTLLQMDALTTCIGLFQAKNDVEKIMHSKHAYTIIYEAKQNDLFNKVSYEMHKYPEDLINKDELKKLWLLIKSMLKKMVNLKDAHDIRNNLDAHKCKSFVTQIELYKKCSWTQSIAFLSVFIKIIELIQDYMTIINHDMRFLYEKYTKDMKNYIDRLEEIKRTIENL